METGLDVLVSLRWLGWVGLLGLGLGLPWRGAITDRQMRLFFLVGSVLSAIYFAVFALYGGDQSMLEWAVLMGSMNYLFIGLMLRSYRLGLSVRQLRGGSAAAMVLMVSWTWACFHSTEAMNVASSFWLGQLMLGWIFWECWQYSRRWPSWSAKGMAIVLALQIIDNFLRTWMVLAGNATWSLLLHWWLLLMGLVVMLLLFDVLQQRKAQLEQSLVGSLAHELRQPLGSMRLKLEHLIADAPSMRPHQAQALLHQLISENDRATAIIQGLRRFFDVSQMQRQNTDLSTLLERLVERLGPDLQSRGMVLEADLQKGVYLLADASQLDMAVYNLVLNAREALQNDPDRGPGCIALRLRATPTEVQLDVSDNGPGVPAQHAARIFDIHFSTKAKGMGLGLWLCRKVVDEHGGQLELLPGAGGAQFRLRLPVHGQTALNGRRTG